MNPSPASNKINILALSKIGIFDALKLYWSFLKKMKRAGAK